MNCIFNFPRPVSECTFITRSGISDKIKGQKHNECENSEGETAETEPDIDIVGMEHDS